MNVSAHRAFSFLRTYGYERVSCSKEERTVAEALLNECTSLGVSAQLEEFTVPCGRVSHALLRVTSPYVKEYEVTGYERAASTPEGGLDTEFLYVENADEVLLEQAKGKIVLVNGYLNRATYEKLRKAEAAAILTFTGRTIDRESESDLNRCKLRETLTEPFGAVPVLNMRAASAAEIVRRGAKTVHIELTGECYDGTSQNVCATIPGTGKAEEVITLGGHYDSVYFSSGVQTTCPAASSCWNCCGISPPIRRAGHCASAGSAQKNRGCSARRRMSRRTRTNSRTASPCSISTSPRRPSAQTTSSPSPQMMPCTTSRAFCAKQATVSVPSRTPIPATASPSRITACPPSISPASAQTARTTCIIGMTA